MEPTLNEFRKIFPEFNDINKSRVEYYMSLAIAQVGKIAFGDCYAQAVYLLTAHMLIMSDPSRAASAVKSSERVGDVAISYDTGSDQNEYLNQTQYGKQFIQLRNSKVVNPMVLDC